MNEADKKGFDEACAETAGCSDQFRIGFAHGFKAALEFRDAQTAQGQELVSHSKNDKAPELSSCAASVSPTPPDVAELVEVLTLAVELYGKEGGPWNVPSDPGGWISKARAVIAKHRGGDGVSESLMGQSKLI